MDSAYMAQCYNCLSDYDAVQAVWCSCNPQRPTKVCPFCLGCFCAADEEFSKSFWSSAPDCLKEEIRTLSESRMLLGDMLVRAGVITTSQLLGALKQQKEDDRRLGEILVESGALPVDRLERFLRSQHTVMELDLARARIDTMLLRRLGVEDCLEDRILPLEAEAFRDRHIMTLAMADPSNSIAVERIIEATGYQVIPAIASAEAIQETIRSIFPDGAETLPTASPVSGVGESGLIEDVSCRRILAGAIAGRASHVRMYSRSLAGVDIAVSFRIDGAFRSVSSFDQGDSRDTLTYLKQLAFQDVGRSLVLNLEGLEHHLELRRGGEDDVVVKIIDPTTFPPRLDDLGMPATVTDQLRDMLDEEIGLILVTSPPMSGGFCTSHAVANHLVSSGRSLILLESPITVPVLDITTHDAFSRKQEGSLSEALTRASESGARCLVVTSPDAGGWPQEHAALPGRMLVVVRCQVPDLPTALVDLIASGYLAGRLSELPTFVMHQRLVPRTCASCRIEVAESEEYATSLGITHKEGGYHPLRQGHGCDQCSATPGFRGLIPIAHSMRVTDAIGRAAAGATVDQMAVLCEKAGLRSLADVAREVVSSGQTTLEKIQRYILPTTMVSF